MVLARWFLALMLVLSLVAPSAAQTAAPKQASPTWGQQAGKPSNPTEQVIASLGKLKLEDVKKNAPGGVLAPYKPDPGTRLGNLRVETRYTEANGNTSYFFNRQGVLVSLVATTTKPVTKDELQRQIKGLEFNRYPPGTYAAFVKRGPKVVQGFYLDPEGKKVVATTFDYLGD